MEEKRRIKAEKEAEEKRLRKEQERRLREEEERRRLQGVQAELVKREEIQRRNLKLTKASIFAEAKQMQHLKNGRSGDVKQFLEKIEKLAYLPDESSEEEGEEHEAEKEETGMNWCCTIILCFLVLMAAILPEVHYVQNLVNLRKLIAGHSKDTYDASLELIDAYSLLYFHHYRLETDENILKIPLDVRILAIKEDMQERGLNLWTHYELDGGSYKIKGDKQILLIAPESQHAADCGTYSEVFQGIVFKRKTKHHIPDFSNKMTAKVWCNGRKLKVLFILR